MVLAAAKVGGIQANSTNPTEFLLENIKIQTNVIENASKFKVKRFSFWEVVFILNLHPANPGRISNDCPWKKQMRHMVAKLQELNYVRLTEVNINLMQLA